MNDLKKFAIAHGLYPHKRRDTNRPRRVETLRRHLDLTKAALAGSLTPGGLIDVDSELDKYDKGEWSPGNDLNSGTAVDALRVMQSANQTLSPQDFERQRMAWAGPAMAKRLLAATPPPVTGMPKRAAEATGAPSRIGSSQIPTVSSRSPGMTPPQPPAGSLNFAQNMWKKEHKPGEFKGFTTPKQTNPAGPDLKDLGVPSSPVPNLSSAAKLGFLRKLGVAGLDPRNIPPTPRVTLLTRGEAAAQSTPGMLDTGSMNVGPAPSPESTGGGETEAAPAPQQPSTLRSIGNIVGTGLDWLQNNPVARFAGRTLDVAYHPLTLGAISIGQGARVGIPTALAASRAGASGLGALRAGLSAAGSMASRFNLGTLGLYAGFKIGDKLIAPHIANSNWGTGHLGALRPGEIYANAPRTREEIERGLTSRYIPGASLLGQEGPNLRAGVGTDQWDKKFVDWLGGYGQGDENQQMWNDAISSYMANRVLEATGAKGGFSFEGPIGGKDWWEKFRGAINATGRSLPPELEAAYLESQGLTDKEISARMEQMSPDQINWWQNYAQRQMENEPAPTGEGGLRNPTVQEQEAARRRYERELSMGKMSSLTDALAVRRLMTKTAAPVPTWIEELLVNKALSAGKVINKRRLATMGRQMMAQFPEGWPTRGRLFDRGVAWLAGRSPRQVATGLIRGRPVMAPWKKMLIAGAAIPAGLAYAITPPAEGALAGVSPIGRLSAGLASIWGAKELLDRTGVADEVGINPWILGSVVGPAALPKVMNTLTGEGPGVLESPWASALTTYMLSKKYPQISRTLGGLEPWQLALIGGYAIPQLSRGIFGGPSVAGAGGGGQFPALQQGMF
ncbi:MAG: hypothetical protein GYA36_19630 [Veillonellaceae bacterium]|nr:hypothetical protein [Veillonellaceae bacterium]